MELEKILTDYLEEKVEPSKKESIDEKFLSMRDLDEDDYEEDEDEDDYEEEDEDEDEEEESDEIDILKITDVEKIKIALDILSNVNDDYPGLEEAIMMLEDIIEENDYED